MNIITDRFKFLREYGFNILTGEGCGLGMRLTTDLDEQAIGILEEFLCVNVRRGSSWNASGENTGSWMMPRNLVDDLVAYILAVVEQYPVVAIVNYNDGSLYANYVSGFSDGEWPNYHDKLNRFFPGGWFAYYLTGTTRNGARNQHVFSGRVE